MDPGIPKYVQVVYELKENDKTMSDTTTTIDGIQMPGYTNQDAIANLPSTLQGNQEERTLTDEEDDDAAVQTSNSNTTKQAWMSYNIKLLLTSKQDTSDIALQHAMLTILESIDREMGADVKIFDGAKQQVTEFQFQPVTTFRSNFPVSRSKAHQKHNRSATAWVLFTVQTRQTLKDIRTHPTIAQVLRRQQCRMIHHQWPLDVTDATSIGFFVGETPTYKLSSTFGDDLRTLIAKKANIKRQKIPKFQVALTMVRARIENPKTKAVVRDACTAFELQVPVGQRRAMEDVLCKVFMNSKANELIFVFYKQRHVHLEVFYKAIQKQRLHEESYRVVAVEGIHPDEVFKFEVILRQKFPEIESILPTSKSTAHNNHGLPIGRYNILCKNSKFSTLAKKLHQEFTGLYCQHLQDNYVELQENHQAVRVTSRLPRSDDSSGTIPSLDSRATFFTHSASIFERSQINWDYSIEFPSVVETGNAVQKQSHPSSPSVTSGITGMSLSTSAQAGPNYASVTAQQPLDPDMLEMKRRLAELETTIQVQQQQLQQTSAPPAPTPPAPSIPPELATKIEDMMAKMSTIPDMMATMSSLRAEIAELRNLQHPTSTPSPARKKVCPNAQSSESHLSEASLTTREDEDAEMDHVS
jgi:hypothetical protein